MITAIQCIILLASTACASTIIPHCRCIKTSKAVRPSVIADVKVYDPRPYCSKKEVIVTLKDKSSRCLDPNGKFTQAVMRTIQLQRVVRAEKMNTSGPKTPTASTVESTTTSATASAPASATAPAIVALTSS